MKSTLWWTAFVVSMVGCLVFLPKDSPGQKKRSTTSIPVPRSAALRVLSRSSFRVARGKRSLLFAIRYRKTATWSRFVLQLSKKIGLRKGVAPANASRGLPRRVFFDLWPCRVPYEWRAANFVLRDSRVARLRLGMHRGGKTRVVLEVKGAKVKVRSTYLYQTRRLVLDVALENQFPWPPRPKDPLPARKLRLRGAPPPVRIVIPKRWRGSGLHQSGLSGYHPRSRFSDRKAPVRLPFGVRVKRIVIDPGHGGRERGTIGLRTGLREKVVTLDLARRVLRYLRRVRGVRFFLTRKKDRTLPLFQRLKVIRALKPDLVISLHVNAHPDRSVSGITTYYMSGNYRQLSFRHFVAENLLDLPLLPTQQGTEHDLSWILGTLRLERNVVVSRILGQTLHQSLMKGLHTGGYKQIKSLGLRRALFFLLYSTGVPAVLIESSFLSNPVEERLLWTGRYREQIASGIARGILQFVKRARNSRKAMKKRQTR